MCTRLPSSALSHFHPFPLPPYLVYPVGTQSRVLPASVTLSVLLPVSLFQCCCLRLTLTTSTAYSAMQLGRAPGEGASLGRGQLTVSELNELLYSVLPNLMLAAGTLPGCMHHVVQQAFSTLFQHVNS